MDTYTNTREAADLLFAGMDLDLCRIIPPLAYQPIPGEETTSPDGVRMFVDRVTEHECGIAVAGTILEQWHWKKAGSHHCFIYRFVPFPQ